MIADKVEAEVSSSSLPLYVPHEKLILRCVAVVRQNGRTALVGVYETESTRHCDAGEQAGHAAELYRASAARRSPLSELGTSLTPQQFFLLERSMDLMPPGVTYVPTPVLKIQADHFASCRKTSFIVDFIGKRKYNTPISLAREWVNVLQDCYPVRPAPFSPFFMR